jgi:hypothetical protein
MVTGDLWKKLIPKGINPLWHSYYLFDPNRKRCSLSKERSRELPQLILCKKEKSVTVIEKSVDFLMTDVLFF